MSRASADFGSQPNTKIPPSWDGVSKSLQEYLEEVEDWLGYTELVDHPERIGPALKSRLTGKPKLVVKSLTTAELRHEGEAAVGEAPATPPGYEILLQLLQDKLRGDESDFKWAEIKRFQKLKKQPQETFREFIALFEVALDRAKHSGYTLGGDGPTYALFEACGLTEEVKQKVLTHTLGSMDFDKVCTAMKRVLDPSTVNAHSRDSDELRNRHMQQSSYPQKQAFFVGTLDNEEPAPSNGQSFLHNSYYCAQQESDSEYEVSDQDREEFVTLYTQSKQATQGLRRFKKPYRPSQGKKRWFQAASGPGPNNDQGPAPRKLYVLDEIGNPIEATHDQIMFASFAKPSTPANGQRFGKNPLDKRTGKRMTCHNCGSDEHFERACTRGKSSQVVNYTQRETPSQVNYFLQKDDEEAEEQPSAFEL